MEKSKGTSDAEILEDIRQTVISARVKLALRTCLEADEFDKTNDRNDWVAYVTAYIGKAADAATNEENDFEEAMLKAAGLCLSAIRANRKGWC